MFVDRIELFVKAGDGGRGMVSFRREKFVPRGGPDGGDGGNGGSVIIRAEANADNLAPLTTKKHWKARNGDSGGGSRCHGKSSQDIIIPVPPGTIVRDRERGNLLKDLVNVGDEVTVAKGGRGGRGNVAFASSTNRTPRQFEPGEDGEERWIALELKVIADAGLIGFPNAGKSTLLSRLSRATPQIADYPFTTKTPNLGIVTLGGDHGFVMADLPGLIEGAHTGVGLGHEFLRHVERTRVLVHLVEPMPLDGSDPVKNYHAIRKELTLYSLALASKPEVVVISKAELTGSDEVRDRLAAELGHPVLLLSSVTGAGLAQVVIEVTKLIAELKAEEAAALKMVKRTEFSIEKAIRDESIVTASEVEEEVLP
ncbi:GTPase ObgE [soil metagenome]